MDLCAVCMEPIADGDATVRLPGCHHAFHCACALNFVQYDIRCPVCRQVPPGVAPRTAPPVITPAVVLAPEEDAVAREIRLSWRRYTDRRRRFFRQCPRIGEAYHQLEEIRAAMRRELATTDRIFQRRCRDTWRDDAEIRAHRRTLTNLRRRELRLVRLLDASIDSNVAQTWLP